MSGLCSSRVLTLGMRRRSLSSFRKRCWLLRAKSTAGEAMVSPFVLDNLNLGGIAGLRAWTPRKRISIARCAVSPQRALRITEDFSGIGYAGAAAPVRSRQKQHCRDQVWGRTAGCRRRTQEVDAWDVMSGTHIPPDDVQGFEGFAASGPDTQGQRQGGNE